MTDLFALHTMLSADAQFDLATEYASESAQKNNALLAVTLFKAAAERVIRLRNSVSVAVMTMEWVSPETRNGRSIGTYKPQNKASCLPSTTWPIVSITAWACSKTQWKRTDGTGSLPTGVMHQLNSLLLSTSKRAVAVNAA